MRIAQITLDGYFPIIICGNAVVNSNYNEMFKKFHKYDDSCLILFNKDEEFKSYYSHNGLDVYAINVNNDAQSTHNNHVEYSKNLAFKIIDLLIEKNINVVFFNDTDSQVYDNIIQNLPSHMIKIAIHHGIDIDFIKNRYYNYHGSIVFTEYQYDSYLNLGLDKNSMVIAPPPLDFSKIKEPTPYEERIPNSLLYMGRIKDYKGCHKIIPYLKDSNIDKYTIIGPNDPENEPKYLDRITKMAKNYDVSSKIEILDPIDNSELIDFASNYEMFIQPSREEGISLVLREAMSAGTIPVARKTLRTTMYGWCANHLYTTSSYKHIMEYIDFIINLPIDEKNRRSTEMFSYMKDMFCLDKVAKDVEEFINKIS